MGKIIYDFREGLEPEKLIFKENTHKCKEFTYWLLYLLLCWTYACGWYALFHWAYINYEDITFWVLAICWIVFVLIFVIVGIVNIVLHKKNKREKAMKDNLEKIVKTEVTIRQNNPYNNSKLENEGLGKNEIIPNDKI